MIDCEKFAGAGALNTAVVTSGSDVVRVETLCRFEIME